MNGNGLLSFTRRPGYRGMLLGLACALAAWGFCLLPLAEDLEEWLQDGWFSVRGPRPSHARVLIVAMDDASLDESQQPFVFCSPQLAEAVRFLAQHKAAAIGIDVLIPASMAAFPELQEGGRGDATVLGQAIAEAGNVVLPEWHVDGGWLRPLPQWQWQHLLDPRPGDLGFSDLSEDDDFFLRRQVMVLRGDDEPRLQFALALVARAKNLSVHWSEAGLHLGDELLPLEDEERLRINFLGPAGTVPVVPLSEVLAAARGKKTLPPDWDPAGAIVILGDTARSQQDYHATPYSNSYWSTWVGGRSALMSGSEIHAQLAAMLLDRAYLTSVPWPLSLLLLLVVGAALGSAFSRLNLGWGLALAGAHHMGWKLLALGLFATVSLRVEMLSMLVLGGLAYSVTFLRRWWVLRRMLGVVKSEKVARLLESDPSQLDMRGEERVVTVLFADIRGFTTFSEKHSAHKIVALLNAYFSAVVPIIEQHEGTLNLYMGDGFMAIFGAPVRQPDHALRAVRAAVAIVRRVHELSSRWAEMDFPGLQIGVGIHTGSVVVGTFGSPTRLEYSAIGDTTNTASRIEEQTKVFGAEILISAQTYCELPSQERSLLGCRAEPREAEVKGKKQMLSLHVVDAEPSGH